MRGGKLLTQSRPEDLIRAYNAVVCVYCVIHDRGVVCHMVGV